MGSNLTRDKQFSLPWDLICMSFCLEALTHTHAHVLLVYIHVIHVTSIHHIGGHVTMLILHLWYTLHYIIIVHCSYGKS